MLRNRLDGTSKTEPFFETWSQDVIAWQIYPVAGSAFGAGGGNAVKSLQECRRRTDTCTCGTPSTRVSRAALPRCGRPGRLSP